VSSAASAPRYFAATSAGIIFHDGSPLEIHGVIIRNADRLSHAIRKFVPAIRRSCWPTVSPSPACIIQCRGFLYVPRVPKHLPHPRVMSSKFFLTQQQYSAARYRISARLGAVQPPRFVRFLLRHHGASHLKAGRHECPPVRSSSRMRFRMLSAARLHHSPLMNSCTRAALLRLPYCS